MKEGKDWSQEFQLDCAEWIFNQFGLGQRGCIEIFLDLWEENFFVVLSSGRHGKLHWKIHCLALDGFNRNTVHKLSSKEEKSRQKQDLTQGRCVGNQECFLCAMQPPPPFIDEDFFQPQGSARESIKWAQMWHYCRDHRMMRSPHWDIGNWQQETHSLVWPHSGTFAVANQALKSEPEVSLGMIFQLSGDKAASLKAGLFSLLFSILSEAHVLNQALVEVKHSWFSYI